ncbi:MAG: ASPIC/UnbV domain-containing protein [Gemmatimonadota bacterium]
MGLGRAMTIDSLRVRWPSGRETLLKGVAPNQVLRVREADGGTRIAHVRPVRRHREPSVAGRARIVVEPGNW